LEIIVVSHTEKNAIAFKYVIKSLLISEKKLGGEEFGFEVLAGEAR